MQQNENFAKHAEQAEAERPEVAEVAFVLRNIGAMDAEDIDGDNVDLRFEDAEGRDTGCDVSIVEYAEKAADLFEQHDRIVGALRAKIAQLRQHKNDYMDAGQETYRALQNEIREREAEIARLDGLVSGRTAERDAALARVKALEALVAARIKDVPVDAPVIAVVGDFNEEQVHECKRFHDAIRAQRNPKAIVVFLNSKNDIQAVDEAAMCAAGWVRAEAPVAQAEQAEAERPEVVAFRYRCTNAEGEPLPGWFYSDDAGTLGLREPLTTVAECDRIVGALRAENERLANDRDRANRFANTAALDNDAALARVAELEKGTMYVEARQCDECQHGGINDSADGLAACHDCDWTGPEPDEDKCPGCHRENCMTAACPACGGRYVLVASDDVTAPVAQAQHSVPDVSGCRRNRSALTDAQMRRLYDNSTEAEKEHLGFAAFARLMRLAEAVHQIAAAPGKEVGHE